MHRAGSCPRSFVRHSVRLFDAVQPVFDIAFAVVLLIFLAFPMAFIALLVKLDSPGPVLYRGLRIGRFGRPFRLLKFRTMVVNADRIGGPSTADDDPRITRVGRFLRKYKLDELPQLFNVLEGEMSLVGPRPEVPQYVRQFTDEERRILDVRPGITDWASIWNSDEGALLKGSPDPERTYVEKIRPQKIRLQLKYVRERSFLTYFVILFQTAAKLVTSRLLSPAGDRTEYAAVTEMPGDGATREQVRMLYTRYHFARSHCAGKRVLEVGCGPGPGLGYLQKVARVVVGGDYDATVVRVAAAYYKDRLPVLRLDAHALPFRAGSFDVLLIFEAIYYLRDVDRFFRECRRVLAPGGRVLVVTVNRRWRGFNPSPYSVAYYDAEELRQVGRRNGLDFEILAGFPDDARGFRARMVGGLRQLAVRLELIPKSQKGKEKFKRLFYGELSPFPAELSDGMADPEPLVPVGSGEVCERFKILYGVGKLA